MSHENERSDAVKKGINIGGREILTNFSREKILFLAGVALGAILLAISLLINSETVSDVFGLAAFAAGGAGVIIGAVRDVLHKRFFSEMVIMAVAGIAAVCIGEITEGVAVMLLFDIGRFCRDAAVDRSRGNVTELLRARPEHVDLLVNGSTVEVPPEEIKAGDLIAVAPGESVAADGVIIRGRATLDTSAITGDTAPTEKGEGDEVYSGCVDLSDTIVLRASADHESSTAARIAKLVEDAERRKGDAQRLVDRFCRVFTPAIFVLVLILGVFVPLIGHLSLHKWMHRALVLLAVSCPCAAAVSVPLAYFTGIGGASRKGVLFKSAGSVDAMAGLTSVFFDKTGTLTTGRFSVVYTEPVRITEEQLLYLAAYAEAYSTHPLAEAITEYSGIKPDLDKIDSHREEKGKGSVVKLKTGEVISAGSIDLLTKLGVRGELASSDSTSVYVAVGRTYVGRIDLEDAVRDDAEKAVRELRELGVANVALITGDNARSATRAAKSIGITEVYSDCLPQDKSERVEYVIKGQEKDDNLAFAGDGISDGPILALADVGIAMGALGSDPAVEAADVAVMTDKPSRIPLAVRAARRIRRIAAESVCLSLAVKLVCMILGAMGKVGMGAAVLADVCATLLAILNAVRAFRHK